MRTGYGKMQELHDAHVARISKLLGLSPADVRRVLFEYVTMIREELRVCGMASIPGLGFWEMRQSARARNVDRPLESQYQLHLGWKFFQGVIAHFLLSGTARMKADHRQRWERQGRPPLVASFDLARASRIRRPQERPIIEDLPLSQGGKANLIPNLQFISAWPGFENGKWLSAAPRRETAMLWFDSETAKEMDSWLPSGKTPNQWWIATFQADPKDTRPRRFPPPGPYWVTDESGRVTAYVRRKDQVAMYWPETSGTPVEFTLHRGEPVFTTELPKPEWWHARKRPRKLKADQED